MIHDGRFSNPASHHGNLHNNDTPWGLNCQWYTMVNNGIFGWSAWVVWTSEGALVHWEGGVVWY